MEYLLVRSAGALAIRGAIAIALGIIALILPGPTYLAMVIAFGVFALFDGLSALVALFDKTTSYSRGWLALEAIAGIVVGVFTFVSPGIAALNMIFVIAAWAIVTGAFRIARAIRLRKEIRGEWLLILSGIASIIFGAILLVMPLPGIVGLMWALGIYGLVFGGLQVALAIRMRRLGDLPSKPAMRPAA